MCITTIANLQRKSEKENLPRYFFSVKEIIQFMDMYWESITTLARKQTSAWHATIMKTLQTHQSLFLAQDNLTGEFNYGLSDVDLTCIKPQYEKAAGQKEEGKLSIKIYVFDGLTLLHSA